MRRQGGGERAESGEDKLELLEKIHMEYIKADKLTFDWRPQMGNIFAERFYGWLKYFKEKAGQRNGAHF